MASSAANLLLLLCHLSRPTAGIIILSEIRPPHTHKLNFQVIMGGPANSNTLPNPAPARLLVAPQAILYLTVIPWDFFLSLGWLSLFLEYADSRCQQGPGSNFPS